MSYEDWTTFTGYSETTMGVFKEGLPPTDMDDILLYVQAIGWKQREDGSIAGKVMVIECTEDFGHTPFDIDIYKEKRNPPYHAIGYSGKRTLKNVALAEEIITGRHFSQWIEFTAELDTDWEEMDFLHRETEA